jgi:hypothetical protein
MKVKIPKWTNLNIPVNCLTLKDVEKRKILLKQIRTHLKENLSTEMYRDVDCELRELFLFVK